MACHFLRPAIVTAVFSQSDVSDEFSAQCVLSPVCACVCVRVRACMCARGFQGPVQGSAMPMPSHVPTEHVRETKRARRERETQGAIVNKCLPSLRSSPSLTTVLTGTPLSARLLLPCLNHLHLKMRERSWRRSGCVRERRSASIL